MQRRLKKGTKEYVVEFDDYGIVDTVWLNSECLNSKNPVVKEIIKNQKAIYLGNIVNGFEKVKP